MNHGGSKEKVLLIVCLSEACRQFLDSNPLFRGLDRYNKIYPITEVIYREPVVETLERHHFTEGRHFELAEVEKPEPETLDLSDIVDEVERKNRKGGTL